MAFILSLAKSFPCIYVRMGTMNNVIRLNFEDAPSPIGECVRATSYAHIFVPCSNLSGVSILASSLSYQSTISCRNQTTKHESM